MSNWAWLTDIHTDHLQNDQAIIDFANRCINDSFDGYFITGDISNSYNLVEHLSMLEAAWNKQIIFCLGNHDFFGDSIENVRRRMGELQNLSPFLKYVSNVSYIPLGNDTVVLGHDGWYDAQNGNAKESNFIMHDWSAISDFAKISGKPQGFRGSYRIEDYNKNAIIQLSQKLASDAVSHVHKSIKEAVRYHKNIIILTHFPPWEEAHIHNGLPGDSNAQPWFTSKMMGQLLESAADMYKNVQFTVLCGHTHSHYRKQMKQNLKCCVGTADYKHPGIQDVISL